MNRKFTIPYDLLEFGFASIFSSQICPCSLSSYFNITNPAAIFQHFSAISFSSSEMALPCSKLVPESDGAFRIRIFHPNC